MRDVVIIGAGPGGLTTALYASRAGRSTLVIEKEVPGGLVATTDEIENWPGILRISGAELAENFRQHAEAFGAEIVMDQIETLDVSATPKRAVGMSETYEGKALVIASGSAPQQLGVPGEAEFRGRGVSYCATCDGAFFRDSDIVCVGGGDAAVQEALYLTRFARKVYLVHRRDELRAVDVLQRRVAASDQIETVWNSVVESIEGEQMVTGVNLRNVKTDTQSFLPVQGVFVYVGLKPATQFVEGQVSLDAHGYIITDDQMATDAPGVFAVGDVRPRIQRQIATAAGDGATAGMAIEHYLDGLEIQD